MKRIYIMFALLAILAIACGGASKAEPTSTPESKAWTACTLFVQRQVGLSPEGAQRFTADGVTDMGDNHWRVDVFYAGESDTYRCDLLKRDDGNWQLDDLSVR
jgi:hypothetical protein